jgi:hypothetical protein
MRESISVKLYYQAWKLSSDTDSVKDLLTIAARYLKRLVEKTIPMTMTAMFIARFIPTPNE